MLKEEKRDKKLLLLEALSWEILGISVQFGVTWLFTGSVGGSLLATLATAVTLYIMYILHRQLWRKIGKKEGK